MNADFEPILLVRGHDAPRETLAEYQARGGYAALRRWLSRPPAELLAEIEASGLRGRGGAAFPTARKWRFAAEAEESERYVVANGGEHEPGSEKDKVLVAKYPHAVLEGTMLCALATGAKKGWVYLIRDMDAQIEAAEAAIAELRAAGLLGEDILGSGFAFDFELHRAPETYVAGEETAAIDSIQGGEGKPREKPPFPGQSGVQGKPTTVNNVETLAHVAAIAGRGAAWFAGIGTAESKGSLLYTLGTEVEKPGVYELPFGASYRDLIEGCGGGLREGKTLRAILPALSSAFVPASELDRPISYESFAAIGSSPGCGGVRLVCEGDDAPALLLEIASFFKKEQCGQCAPCRMVTNQIAHVLQAVLDGKGGPFDRAIGQVADFARGQGYCSLTTMCSTAILRGLELFGSDLRALEKG
jgi:NADH:ubiquinone oxidoreductase subunit F (NADH-binding)